MRGRITLVAMPVLAMVGALLSPALAQVVLTSDEDSVVIDGDLVRILDADGNEIDVHGDWRNTGNVYVASDTDRILTELGAVIVDDRIQLNLAGDILFPFDSSEIGSKAASQLAKVAHVIRSRSVGEIHVIGHTDSVGEESYNKRLSRERAVSVMRWLSSQEAIPAAIMVGSGMGSEQPMARNRLSDGSDNPAGRARNRRVEIQLATREGVRLGPGVVEVGEDRVTVGGVEVDDGGVSVGGVRIATHEDADSPKQAPRGGGTATCAELCESTSGKHPLDTIACLEGAFEELGFDLDEGACDELEDAMYLGMGNSGGSLCTRCQQEQGWRDRDCAVVASQCFSSR